MHGSDPIDWAVERGILEFGPYGQLEVTDRAWPVCVALIVAGVLVVAFIEHGTVIV